MKSIIKILLIVAITSCSSLKSKQKYVKKQYKRIENSYPVSNNYLMQNKDLRAFDLSFSSDIDLSDSVLRKIRKKEIDMKIGKMERVFALIPDSSQHIGQRIDSFYRIEKKKEYLIKNGLKTDNIHFY